MAAYRKEGHFDRVGPMALDVEIGLEDAERLRKIGMLYAPIVRKQGVVIGDESTEVRTSARASGSISDGHGDYEVAETQFFAKTILLSRPDSWTSIMHWTKFRDSHRDVKIAHRFETSVMEGEVIGARRRVYVARDISRVAIQDGEPIIEKIAPRQYKMFERPTTQEDIDFVDRIARQTVARAAVSRKS